jgi:hypothetical protein
VRRAGGSIGPAAGELAERLAAAPGWAERMAILGRAIAARVLEAPPVAPELDWAWERLLGSDGAVGVGDLAAVARLRAGDARRAGARGGLLRLRARTSTGTSARSPV